MLTNRPLACHHAVGTILLSPKAPDSVTNWSGVSHAQPTPTHATHTPPRSIATDTLAICVLGRQGIPPPPHPLAVHMRLTIRILGAEVFHVSTEPDPDEDDYSRDLSGGNLGSDCIDAGQPDLFLGFTNGREAE